MKITPLDIRQKEFKRGLRGYVDVEVDEFLDQVAEEFERLFKENIDLTERAEALKEKVSGYKRIEDALQKTLVSAQTGAEEVKQNAATAAQLVLHEAELKARQMMNTAYGEKQAVEQTTARLASIEEDFRFKFREMLQGYLKRAEQAPESEPGPAVGVSETQSDFARHADAIREAISREETATPPPETPAVGVSETQSDFARHADAIREAISREETALLPPEASSASGSPEETAVPPPETPAAPKVEAAQAEEQSGADAPATPVEPVEPAPKASEEEGSEPSIGSELRPSEGSRILFGERDGLLADVDTGVDENEFKW